MERKVAYNNLVFEYKVFGSGDKYILAFHGLGREADDYKIFEKNLGEKYTIISVNLYHHGNSEYPEERMFKDQITKKELQLHIEKLLEEFNIESFTLMGYSLGGRVALTCVQLFSKRINRIILIAPDGLKINYYNEWVTKTKSGKNFVKGVVKHPDKFFDLIDKLNRYKLIRNSYKRNIKFHFETHEKRILMRNVISTFRNITPNLSKVTRYINSNKIDVVMIFGKHDFIIPISLGKKFLKDIKTNKKLHVIDASHNILTENASKQLSELIE